MRFGGSGWFYVSPDRNTRSDGTSVSTWPTKTHGVASPLDYINFLSTGQLHIFFFLIHVMVIIFNLIEQILNY